MTPPSPASAEPISAADRERIQEPLTRGILIHDEAIGALPAYEARVVELEAALAQSKSFHADAEAWGRDLEARLVSDHAAAEARATALLETLRLVSEWAPLLNSAKKKANVVPLTEFQHGFNCAVKGIGDFTRAAINAGASNDRK